jgi:hypothetical protein
MSIVEADAWFNALEPDKRGVLLELRELIKASDPAAIEEIKWGRPCYSNSRGMFCYLHKTKSHATLGFQNGALLDDPEGFLEGTGKDMRHVKIRPHDPARSPNHPAIVSLIRQAASR